MRNIPPRWLERFSINWLAKDGEEFLTQFTVRPDEPGYATKEKAEETLKNLYGEEYELRFEYEILELGGVAVSSKEFGRSTVTPEVANRSFGGAVFGRKK